MRGRARPRQESLRAGAVARKPTVVLQEPGWSPVVKRRLEELIAQGAWEERPVVFDLDNTVLCRDIGEATFAILERDGIIRHKQVPASITPSFTLEERRVDFHQSDSLFSYYYDLGDATAHHKLDISTQMVGYSWVVQIMEGMTPLDIVKATAVAFDGESARAELTDALPPSFIDIPGSTRRVLRPFFNPQMVELIGTLLDLSYDVWIISSSNSWTVRWILLEALNKELKARGHRNALAPTRIMGINTLLIGDDGRLYKDGYLVWENEKYANLDPAELGRFRLTSLAVPPPTASFGKVAEILKWIGEPPYLVAGDSFGDIPMLQYGQHRLWMARLELPEFQEYVAPLSLRGGVDGSWMIQPVLTKNHPGFVNHIADLDIVRGLDNREKINMSLAVYNSYGLLDELWDIERGVTSYHDKQKSSYFPREGPLQKGR